LHHPFAKVNITAIVQRHKKALSNENRCLYPKFPDQLNVCFSTPLNKKLFPNSLTNADLILATSDEGPGDSIDGRIFSTFLKKKEGTKKVQKLVIQQRELWAVWWHYFSSFFLLRRRRTMKINTRHTMRRNSTPPATPAPIATD
jgi:hypothetical protein